LHSRHEQCIGVRMLANQRDTILSEDNYCSVFNAHELPFLTFAPDPGSHDTETCSREFHEQRIFH